MKPEDLTIFIVDDDASILRSVKRLMRSAGYRKVEIFASTEDFLSGMVPKEPCLLIADLLLPGMGGIELYHRLREEGRAIQPVNARQRFQAHTPRWACGCCSG